MHPLAARATRAIYRKEAIPPRLLWWMAASGMRDWLRILARGLKPHLGEGARPRIASVTAKMLRRRYDHLRLRAPDLPAVDTDPRALPLVMGALYRMHTDRRSAWLFDDIGGPPRDAREWWRASRLVQPFDARSRWEEMTVHLGELLIVLTEDFESVPRGRKILGDICFESGARYGEQARRLFGLDRDPRFASDPAALAIEVLRMTEYVFRVNPSHWGGTDASANTGWLEGTACPWYSRPGWEPGHCGIFGQFQSGICSAFGLRYTLAKTIPKHGGDTCRVDLKPVQLRRGRDGAAL